MRWDLSGGALTVQLGGEVCTWSARRVEPVLRAVLSSLGPDVIDIDLSAVTFFDARGVRVLVGVTEWARDQGRPCRVIGSSETCRRVLAACGFETADVLTDAPDPAG